MQGNLKNVEEKPKKPEKSQGKPEKMPGMAYKIPGDNVTKCRGGPEKIM